MFSEKNDDDDDAATGEQPVRHPTSGLIKLFPDSVEDQAHEPIDTARGDPSRMLEFVELVLRDLQNPVTVLDASMTLLIQGLRSGDPDTRFAMRDAQRAVRRIQQYIDHLVTSTRVSDGSWRLQARRVEVGSLLADLVDEYAHHARACEIDVELDLGRPSTLTAMADDVLLHRAFRNLLESSMRRATSGGSVRVWARGGSVIEVRFCNSGPPATPDEREQMFEKCAGATSGTRKSSIGLHFARLAIVAHRGTVVIEDEPEWPLCFAVRLPIAAI